MSRLRCLVVTLGCSQYLMKELIMTKLIYHVACTLDGFIADIQGDCPANLFPTSGDHIADFLQHINKYRLVLMGGNTYRYGFKFGLQPGQPAYQGLKHYIFSRRLNFVSNADVQLITTDAIAYIRYLKQQEQGDIWLCGGGQLAGQLLHEQLIDQLRLKINPSLAGCGIYLFGNKINIPKFLRLKHSKSYASGVVLNDYDLSY